MLRIVALASAAAALAPPARPVRQAHRLHSTAENVAQTQETSRDKVMTFSYDTERERKYAKPVYKGTGDGLGGDEGEYDVVVIGSGMGGLACGAMCAKYDLGVPRCCGAFTPSMRLVSIRRGRGWFLFRF